MREAFRVEYLLMKDAVVTFQKLEYPFTIHIKIKIVGKHMLDKFLTGENVELNGEIAGRRHILRTL
jgi:hypothetical protein